MRFSVKDILHMEVAPALGCTEPVAVALAAASAASLFSPQERPRSVDHVEVWTDPNVYKNGLAVSIPGANDLKGLDTAAALGAVGGDPARRLEVLGSVSTESRRRAMELKAQNKATVNLLADRRGLFIRARVHAGGHVAEAEIQGLHDNITLLQLDGQEITSHPLRASRAMNGTGSLEEMEGWLVGRSLDEIIALTDELDNDDFTFLMEGIKRNELLAAHGLKHGSGLGVGRALDRLVRQGLMRRDMLVSARILTSAAADARMAGVNLPAMSSAGSGNHGLTAILPIRAVFDHAHVTEKQMLEAVALSHMITAYVKAHTGRLSAVCGCSVAAGAGAAAGVAYLLGGHARHVAGAIKNLVADLAGIICDGAKASCALKLNTAAGSAVQSALFALQGVDVADTDGIVGCTSEQTMRNVGELSTQGMIETDRTILKIMIEKQIKARTEQE
ncbi:MAG: L-serine ammonia-lyase, iron-sulfur-dependent, subunit alpha [Desulfovibrio sp.]|nr:L-serine ammonia-lyase, iron-sulfur-dependent, subunit alpha [Desulfovibrio sp.]